MRKPSVETMLRVARRGMKERDAKIAKMERRMNWGNQMSNLCFNLSQNASVPEHIRESMRLCYKGWDEA